MSLFVYLMELFIHLFTFVSLTAFFSSSHFDKNQSHRKKESKSIAFCSFLFTKIEENQKLVTWEFVVVTHWFDWNVNMSWEMQLEENLLEELYIWLDSLTLSRPKKRIERDFSDGKLSFVSDRMNMITVVMLFCAFQEFSWQKSSPFIFLNWSIYTTILQQTR